MLVNNLYSPNEEVNIESYLLKCGVTDLQEYLNPTGSQIEPFENYNNFQKGYELFVNHISKQSNICLYADVDNDGITSYSIMYRYIKELNPNIKICTIINEGKIHGITQDVLDCVYNNNCQLLIIPDAGSNDYNEHKDLKNNNVDVLCLDHHEASKLSENAVIINNQLSEDVRNKFACGSSITYKFVTYCEQQFDRKMGWKYIDLCACGLIGDVMSLVPIENRTYVCFGLKHITNPFLKYLCDNLINKNDVTPKDIAFSLVPKINSLIRENIKEHKYKLLECFAEDLDETIYKEMLSICLNSHKQQKKIVEKMYNDIVSTIKDEDKVIFGFTEKSAYTGLVCGKLSEQFNKPTLLIYSNNDEYFGSARSPIPFKDILGNSNLMTVNQGHSMAWGVGFKETDLKNLKEYCNNLDLNTEVIYDVTKSYSSEKIPSRLFKEFADYNELWNNSIPKPLYYIYNININSNDINVIGKNHTTVKFSYKGIDYIKFFVSHSDQESVYHIGECKNLSLKLIGELQQNIWNGQVFSQVVITKIEVETKNESMAFESIW